MAKRSKQTKRKAPERAVDIIESVHARSANATPPIVARMPGITIERFIDAAQAHGEQSDPDHEVGDLQSLVRALWNHLTPTQRAAFFTIPPWEVEAILAWEDTSNG